MVPLDHVLLVTDHRENHPQGRRPCGTGHLLKRLDCLRAEGRSKVFLDASGFAHDMSHTQLRSARKALLKQTQRGRKGPDKRLCCPLGKALLALALIFGVVNTSIVNACSPQDLMPKWPPKSVIVMDRPVFIRTHPQNALKKAGYPLLDLPPHSRDLNPINHKWEQAKKLKQSPLSRPSLTTKSCRKNYVLLAISCVRPVRPARERSKGLSPI